MAGTIPEEGFYPSEGLADNGAVRLRFVLVVVGPFEASPAAPLRIPPHQDEDPVGYVLVLRAGSKVPETLGRSGGGWQCRPSWFGLSLTNHDRLRYWDDSTGSFTGNRAWLSNLGVSRPRVPYANCVEGKPGGCTRLTTMNQICGSVWPCDTLTRTDVLPCAIGVGNENLRCPHTESVGWGSPG